MKVLSYKVLSYLEVVKATFEDKDVDRDSYLIEVLENDMNFYSQPFKPELITELFGGWKYDGLLFTNKNYEIQFTKYQLMEILGYYSDDDCGIINGVNENGKLFYEVIIPRTLDEFITDCQRAGIELTWKEQENDTEI